MCGSTIIDRNFHEWMEKQFGQSYRILGSDVHDPSGKFFRRFEQAKKSFTGPGQTRRVEVWPINMDVPRSSYYDKANFTVRLKA
jgi:hypothetical protein